MSKQPKDRFTGYSDNGIPALRIAPSLIRERRSRYILLHLITVWAILIGIVFFFFSTNNNSFWLCFGPGIFLFFSITWIGYWWFGKANSRIIKIICDKEKTKIIHGKKEETYSSDKLRFEVHVGEAMFQCFQIKLFLRRPPKRRKILLRLVAIHTHQDIKIVRNFCTKNELHYKESISAEDFVRSYQ